MNLNDINNLTNKILSESTHQKDDFLNRWPYTSPYLEEKKSYKYKNCGCGKNPCETYGDKAEPVSEGATHKGLEKVASKLEGASKAHAKQAAKIRDHVEDMKEENLAEIAPALAGVLKMGAKAALRKGAMKVANKVTQNPSDDEEMSEELNPKLKAIDAKNKARVEAEGRAAAAERQKKRESADAYRKKLGMEHVETVSKLIESNQFSEEELLKIIESM